MECQEALNEIGRLNDGELPAAERAALEAHFSGCESCRQAYEGLRASDAQLLRAFLPRRQAATA
ncbi:MAG TPA: zf-HC2 domain-containing protein, partial [Pirellulales bacterium]|nr:zf-HC2 domain-containing protein [Pirellulales bacterium]